MSVTGLFGALGAIPALPGARCRGLHDLFDPRDADDPDREDIEERALWICASCCELTACRMWLESLRPKQRPLGVVAGQVIRPKPVGRPRKVAS